MTDYFGFIYKWTDSTNGKTYTGSHKGSIEDAYDGSGKLFKHAYKKRPDKFSREILEYVYENSKDILLEREQKYLNLINWDNTYNVSAGANGGNTRAGYTEEQLRKWKQKQSESHSGENNPMFGRKHKEETKQKMIKNHIGMTGKKHKEETKK